MKPRTIFAVAAAAGLALATWTAFAAARTKNLESKMMINKSTPVLHVKSVEPSLKFWTERFGFKKTVEVPEGDHLGFIALDINAVAESLKGAEIVQPIHDTFYGSKEIVVKEPGGHFVIFSQMPQR